MQFSAYPHSSKSAESPSTSSQKSSDDVKRELTTSERNVSEPHSTTDNTGPRLNIQKLMSKLSSLSRKIPKSTGEQNMGCEKMSQHSPVNSGASARNGNDSGSDRSVQSKRSSDRAEIMKQSKSETLEHKHPYHSKKETADQSSFRSNDRSSPQVKEGGKSSQVKHFSHSNEDRHRKSSQVKHSSHSNEDRHGKSSQGKHSPHSNEDRHGKSSQVKHSPHSNEDRHGKSSQGKHSPHSNEDRHGKSSQVKHSPHSNEDRHGKSSQGKHSPHSNEDRHGKSSQGKHSPHSNEDRHGKSSQGKHSPHSNEDRHGKSSQGKHSPHSNEDRHGKSSQVKHSPHSNEDRHGKSSHSPHSGEDRHGKSSHSPHSGEDRHGKSSQGQHSPHSNEDRHGKSSQGKQSPHSNEDRHGLTNKSNILSADKASAQHKTHRSSADSTQEEKLQKPSFKERDTAQKTGKVSPAQKENSKSPSNRSVVFCSDKTSSKEEKSVTKQSSVSFDGQTLERTSKHHSEHSSHSDKDPSKQSSDAERHSGLSSGYKKGSPEKHENSDDQSSGDPVLEGDNQNRSFLPQSSDQDAHKDCDSDQNSAKSVEVEHQAGKHSSPDGHASSESDGHVSKSHRRSHSDKHRSACYDSHVSKDSDKSAHTKHSSKDGQASEKSSGKSGQLQTSRSHHKRLPDGETGALKSVEGHIKGVLKSMEGLSGKQASSGGERKKRVSIQLEDDSHSQCSSLKSPASEVSGCIVEMGSPAVSMISPDVLSEKENELSERQPSTDEKDHSLHETSTSKTNSSISGDMMKGRRHSTGEGHSSSGHKSPRRPSGSRHSIEIKEITLIVNENSGYITSPDISSEEEGEQEEKSVRELSVSARCTRTESTNSQTGDEVGPSSLTKHQLKPSLERQGGSYEERLKVIEKLMNVKHKMDENEKYHRKRAARGDVKKRRAKREKLEGDFSGSCLEKIEYTVEEKPSLKRPEPKPEEPKPEKPPKEKKEKPKRERKVDSSKLKEKRQSKPHLTARSKRPSKDGEDLDQQSSRREKKRSRSSSVRHEDTVRRAKTKHSRKEIHRSSSLVSRDQDSSPPSDKPDPSVLKAEFAKMRSVWGSLFGKPKQEASEDSAVSPAADGSDRDVKPSAKRTRTSTDDEEEEDGGKEKRKKMGNEGEEEGQR